MKDYLPLFWEDHYQTEHDIGKMNLSIQDIQTFIDENVPEIRRIILLKKKQKFCKYLSTLNDKEETQLLDDLNIYSLLKIWNKGKQSFRFDKDFLDELIKTETLYFMKDAWNYLPYSCFYIDISENPSVCQKAKAKGFFCRLVAVPAKELWQIKIASVTEDTIESGNVFAWNRDMELKANAVEKEDLVQFLKEENIGEHSLNRGEDEKEIFNFRMVLISQILTYLSSAEPDMELTEEESASTVNTTSPLHPKKKKQTSPSVARVRKWNVGFRFGTAFRKWQQQNQSGSDSDCQGNYKVRPHLRHAHWQHYWYGKKTGTRIRRLKWISEYFVNVSNEDSLPAVIHECG